MRGNLSERDAEIVAKRAAGATYAAISREYGLTPSGARLVVLRARARAGRPPEVTTKDIVLAMLLRPEGVTAAQIAEAICRQPYEVHQILHRLRREGVAVATIGHVTSRSLSVYAVRPAREVRR